MEKISIYLLFFVFLFIYSIGSNVYAGNTVICKANDHKCYFEESKKYSAANKPNKALDAVSKAVQLSPNNLTYLKNRGIIANWISNLDFMHDSYARILALQPNDKDGLLGMARYLSQSNKLDISAKVYMRYLTLYPKTKEAWIEFANVQIWRGNVRGALQALRSYKSLFGETKIYKITKARALAWGDRPTQSLNLINPLLQQQPRSYDLNVLKALSLFFDKQFKKSLKTLQIVKEIQPNSKETIDLNEFILNNIARHNVSSFIRTTTPLRSNINLGGFYSWDTDTIHIFTANILGQYYFNPNTSLFVNLENQSLKVHREEGLETIDGKKQITAQTFWLGLRHRLNRLFEVEAYGGNTHIKRYQDLFIYYLGGNVRFNDHSTLYVTHKRELYAVSPRAVSLGINRKYTELELNYQPWIQRYFNASVSKSYFSDRNRMWRVFIKPSIGVVRNELLNLNVGVSGIWFGFAKNLNNGYYDPSNYRYYAVTLDAYIKQSYHVGYAVSLSRGVQKDETFRSYSKGYDAAIKGYFGIYKDWMLVVACATSNRDNSVQSISNNRNYRVSMVSAVITKRF